MGKGREATTLEIDIGAPCDLTSVCLNTHFLEKLSLQTQQKVEFDFLGEMMMMLQRRTQWTTNKLLLGRELRQWLL